MGKLWEPGPRYYNQKGYRDKKKSPFVKEKEHSGWKKLMWQTFAALLIFFLIWGTFQLQGPFMSSCQSTIRTWFTTDYDIEPVLRFFSDVGLWGDTLDRAVFDTVKSPSELGPIAVPASGQVIKPFGWIIGENQAQVFHDGITIATPEGTPVKAAMDGVVCLIANEEEQGRIVEIKSEEGYITRYAHCSEILVNINDEVKMGQVIAKVGKTGNAKNPQLYFGIFHEGEPLDPAGLFLPDSKST